MPLSVEQVGDVSVIVAPKFLDVSNHEQFQKEVVHVLQKRKGAKVLLDLSGMDFIDSSGIADLLYIYREARDSGGSLRIAGASPKVIESLELVRMGRIIQMHPSRKQAIEAFGG